MTRRSDSARRAAGRRRRAQRKGGSHKLSLGGWLVLLAIIGITVVISQIAGAGKSSPHAGTAGTSTTLLGSSTPTTGTSTSSSSAAPSAITTPPVTSPSITLATFPSSAASTAPASVGTSAMACHARGTAEYVLPDAACTPGATNQQVTQANIEETICKAGWTSTVRPPESYTEKLKFQQMDQYGEGGSASGYEEDHLVPLELGGSPDNPKNLWPEPGASPNPKDSVEDAANRAVCNGQMTLAAAQQAIAADWIALGQRLGVTSHSIVDPLQAPSSSPISPAAATTSLPTVPTLTPGPAGPAPTPSCTVTASYDAQYNDYDVYIHSNEPEQAANVATSGGAMGSYKTDSSGNADVYLHASNIAGQLVTASVGGATCTSTVA